MSIGNLIVDYIVTSIIVVPNDFQIYASEKEREGEKKIIIIFSTKMDIQFAETLRVHLHLRGHPVRTNCRRRQADPLIRKLSYRRAANQIAGRISRRRYVPEYPEFVQRLPATRHGVETIRGFRGLCMPQNPKVM